MKKMLILVLGLCLGFSLTANADCCTPKNLRVTCSDADGVVSISWENDCNSKYCVHGLFTLPDYEVTITGSINRSYRTEDKLQGNTSDMYLPRGGSITVTIKCLQHRDQITASCTRTSSGSINKPCGKALPRIDGHFYISKTVGTNNTWQLNYFINTAIVPGPLPYHTSNCRLWFYSDPMLMNGFNDGYANSAGGILVDTYLSKIYVKVVPADINDCGDAATEHYWVGEATLNFDNNSGPTSFTWREVCR